MHNHNLPIETDNRKFKGSIKRLYKEISVYKKVLVIAIILAIVSSIISIISPRRISDLTDEISKGLMINENKLVEVMETIGSNFSNNVFEPIVIDNITISVEEQTTLINLAESLKDETNREVLFEKINLLPESVQKLIKPKMNLDKVLEIAILTLILYSVSNLFSYIQSIITMKMSVDFSRKIRGKIAKKINFLPLNFFDKTQTGDILSRVTNDVDVIVQATSQSITTLISSVVMLVGAVVMMFYTNWILAISAIFASVFGFIFMGIILGKSQKYFIEKQKQTGNLNSHIEEIYSSLNVVKVYNGKELSLNKFNKLNNKVKDSNEKSQFLSGLMMPMMHFVGNFGYVVVIIVGALLAMNNHITFGVIISFTLYVRLFNNPLSQIAQGMNQLQSVSAASGRVFEFLDEKDMPEENPKVTLTKKDVKGNVEFKNVSFKYPGNKNLTIKKFNVNIKQAEKIAIVGPTGAGKTTIVNLLMRFYDLTSGDIKIDNVSINDLSRENVHDLFTMVLQDTWLFEGTIKENIKFNNPNISDEKINEICTSIGLDHFIKTLPDGYNTIIGDNDGISSGQKQLITIARGMAEFAPLLILDEATSNVDTRTEELVSRAMDKLMEGKTSFVIAHRLSTIKNADLILVMKDGNIIETGNHQELMDKNGFYAELYNSQFEL